MEEFIKIITESKLMTSGCVIVIAYLIYKTIKFFVDKSTSNKKIDGKRLTYIKLFMNLLKYVLIIISLLIILQLYGVNVSSLLAGLGIAGIIVAFAVQDFLKDIISGFNLIADDVFKVGDVVKYNDIEGKVISIGLKNTKIKDIRTDDIFNIANRNILEVVNVSEVTDISIPIPYNVAIEEAEYVLTGVAEQIKTFENVKDVEFFSLVNFKESYMEFMIRFYSNPAKKLPIRRKALRLIKMTLDKNNIKIPYNQLDVHIEK